MYIWIINETRNKTYDHGGRIIIQHSALELYALTTWTYIMISKAKTKEIKHIIIETFTSKNILAGLK